MKIKSELKMSIIFYVFLGIHWKAWTRLSLVLMKMDMYIQAGVLIGIQSYN